MLLLTGLRRTRTGACPTLALRRQAWLSIPMPTTKTVQHLTDLDYDLAQLGDPLDGDALDALSSVIDARDTLAEMTHLVQAMQTKLEAGAPAYATREEYAFDLDQLADRLHIAISGVLG